MSWPLLVGIFLGLSALLLIKPSAVYDNFFQFLYWISLAYAPVVGIVLVDYFLLRRQTLEPAGDLQSAAGGVPTTSGGGGTSPPTGGRGRRRRVPLLLNPVSLWYSAPFPT
jgi:purine-cytosine permease-like protein